ncbi:HD family phosphohydrolase [Comamonas phosphati]|nr:HD family phosphohydrolase [Comamonas phosphati]
MYVQLDVGWLDHPFWVNNFKITSSQQLQTLKGLGLQTVHYVPGKSDAFSLQAEPVRTDVLPAQESAAANQPAPAAEARSPVDAWRCRIRSCEQRFMQVRGDYDRLEKTVQPAPSQARMVGESLIDSCMAEIDQSQDVVLHLLSEQIPDGAGSHAVNVSVLALLLGRAMGMPGQPLRNLGLAALLHDVGKQVHPPAWGIHGMNVQQRAQGSPERVRYEMHVGESVALTRRMALSADVSHIIAQHHEWADGTGFPLRLAAAELERSGQILCLVNGYDRLCNPLDTSAALTPHEILAWLYSQYREKFLSDVLVAFVRMMGVYPPGSLIELHDGRFGLVTSVNSAYPLKPSIMVYDPGAPEGPLLLLELQASPQLGIRRGLNPSRLPPKVLDALLPRQRICYYFEAGKGTRPADSV